MSGQNAMRSEIRAKPSAAMDGAPLKLEQFLPYQLNVVAALVSEALSRVYARRYRIGIPEWRVLVTLGQFGVMTGKAFGTHTHMHKTKVATRGTYETLFLFPLFRGLSRPHCA
jgi:hypothetical protein